MSNDIEPFYTLHSANCSLVLDCRDHCPAILYWGPRLSQNASVEMLSLVTTGQELPACPPQQEIIEVSPQTARGFTGSPGIQLHRDDQQWSVATRLRQVNCSDDYLLCHSYCEGSEVELIHRLEIHQETDMLSFTTEIINRGSASLWLQRCDAACVPMPDSCDRMVSFSGRWAAEFQTQLIHRFSGAFVRENRSGRTSHDAFPGVVLHGQHTNESAGIAYGLHLGWSGNHHLRVEQQYSGRSYVQFGELFYPGEVCLKSGQSYTSPTLYGVCTDSGLSGLSQAFHGYVRNCLTDPRVRDKPRPVHFNTWEAMYFDLSETRLFNLADRAAEVGVERFVLDDGWFKNRRSDRAGLGDWFVDQGVFPDGLSPLINHVHEHQMEFGLWVEPEMVNPNSDLYRSHPDWVLRSPAAPQIVARNQLVLDLTRSEVQSYLFDRLNDLLSEYPIDYLKWDMNRTNFQPSNGLGQAVGHSQTLAVYELMSRLRRAHPSVEIESCCSGGGRADFGILAHTDRIWTSDSNDAMDRLEIQRGFSFFFPPEIMGSHVGPNTCHITGRVLTMETRAAVAMFGHMGIEADLTTMTDQQLSTLQAAVALHKEHRPLLHSGRLRRLDTDSAESAFGVLASDGSEAIFSYAQLSSLPHSVGGQLRFVGLNREGRYRICIIWPQRLESYSESVIEVINGAIISGDVLMNVGIQLPIMNPQTLLVFHLQQLK